MNTQYIPKSASQRNGFGTIAVLALLAVATALFVAWSRNALLNSQHQKKLHDKAQAFWLVESGIQRAKAKLFNDTNYLGETWEISSQEIGLSNNQGILSSEKTAAAVVTIKVTPYEGFQSYYLISVESALSPDSEHRVKHRRTIRFQRIDRE